MGTMHLTNRGMATLTIAMWNAPADIGVGLLVGSSIPGALTQAAIYDVNFVSELLALTGVDEPGGAYGRVNPLTLGTAVEDDTNDRINYPANDADFGGTITGFSVYAAFVYVDGGSDAARVVLGVDLFTSAYTAVGTGFVYRSGGVTGMADLIRVTH